MLATWIAALLTLGILSFLYRDNRFFRFTESLFAGVSLGYYIGIVCNNTLKPNLVQPLMQDFMGNKDLIVAGVLGLLLYARYVAKIDWVSRWALASYVGYYVGINMVQRLQGDVLPQLRNTMVPLNAFNATTLNNLIVAVGVISVLFYFFFSREHTGALAGISRVGIIFLMVSFGAAFGYTVMGRISLLIGRMNFLWSDWILGTVRSLSG
jgi:hypothetical protein